MIIKYRHSDQYNIDINMKIKYPNINDLIIEIAIKLLVTLIFNEIINGSFKLRLRHN